eukprot:5518534-Pleurochrysis_carterae.AAC.1
MSCSISVQKCIGRVPRRILLHHHLLLIPFRCCQRPRHTLSDHCPVVDAQGVAQNRHQGPGRYENEDACPSGGTRWVVVGVCLGDETCAWAQGQTRLLQNQTTHQAGQ